jgi:hypothetical protein
VSLAGCNQPEIAVAVNHDLLGLPRKGCLPLAWRLRPGGEQGGVVLLLLKWWRLHLKMLRVVLGVEKRAKQM